MLVSERPPPLCPELRELELVRIDPSDSGLWAQISTFAAARRPRRIAFDTWDGPVPDDLEVKVEELRALGVEVDVEP